MNGTLEALWEKVRNWANQNAQHYVLAPIPKERTDLQGPDDPLVPYRDYVRLWLTDMFLSKQRSWVQDLYPAVHTAVSLRFGPAPVKITHVTDGSGQLAHGPNKDYALTDLIPFSGGTVEIQSGLIALKGKDYLSDSIRILKDFSGLVGAPLGQALTIADKVANGVQTLFNSGNGEITLGFHRQYMAGGAGGGNVLKPGYLAIISATPSQVEQSRLSVKESELFYQESAGAEPKSLEKFDYMLFRIEGRKERDNWRMPNIEEPLSQAIRATVEGEAEKAKQYKTAALLVVWQSPDLAVQDRRRVAKAIEDELAEIAGQPRGALGVQLRSLEDIMNARAMPVAQALREPDLTATEILQS
jgi:hypothetical protein